MSTQSLKIFINKIQFTFKIYKCRNNFYSFQKFIILRNKNKYINGTLKGLKIYTKDKVFKILLKNINFK